MATRADHFDTEIEALNYMMTIEPTVPLISLGGRSPLTPLPYDQFVKWKEENKFKEYDYKKMFEPGGTNPREVIYKKRY